MRARSVLALLVVALATATSAFGMSASQHLRHANTTLASAHSTIRFFQHHSHLLYRGPLRTRRVAWHEVHRARARIERAKHEQAVALRVLHPVPAVGHLAGWQCITNGAHPGTPRDPHEGNGYAGSYSGPLGMTTPWLGHMPPGSDWVHSDRLSVYAIAEDVAARYGFNYSFMRGQWPNTFPPCAGFFTH